MVGAYFLVSMECLAESMTIDFYLPTTFKGNLALIRFDDPSVGPPSACQLNTVEAGGVTKTSIMINIVQPSTDTLCGNEFLAIPENNTVSTERIKRETLTFSIF